MEEERKKKSGRLKLRMRGALAKLGRRHVAGDYVTLDNDETNLIVLTEQQPEVVKPGVVSPPSDEPASKAPIKGLFRRVRAGRKKKKNSTSGSEKRVLTETITAARPLRSPEVTETLSCSGLFESDLDRLILPADNDDDYDDVTSADKSDVDLPKSNIREVLRPETEALITEDEVSRYDGRLNVTSRDQPEVIDVIIQSADEEDADQKYGGKHKRKRNLAKRYTKQAGVRAWKGVRSSWKFFYSGLVMLTTSPVFTLNVNGGLSHAWQQWHGNESSRSDYSAAYRATATT